MCFQLCAELLDYRPLNGTVFTINSTNQDEVQCLNIAEYIIDDGVVEDLESFNLSLSILQASFPVGQLTFYRPVTQIFIVDDDMPGKMVYNTNNRVYTQICMVHVVYVLGSNQI